MVLDPVVNPDGRDRYVEWYRSVAGATPNWRERLDDGLLDIRVAVAGTPLCRTRLVLAAATGRLGRSAVFKAWRTTNMHITSANGEMRLARDGETFDGTSEFDIVKNGDRLAVYTPQPPEGT